MIIFAQELHLLLLSHNDAEVWKVLACCMQGTFYTQTQKVEFKHYQRLGKQSVMSILLSSCAHDLTWSPIICIMWYNMLRVGEGAGTDILLLSNFHFHSFTFPFIHGKVQLMAVEIVINMMTQCINVHTISNVLDTWWTNYLNCLIFLYRNCWYCLPAELFIFILYVRIIFRFRYLHDNWSNQLQHHIFRMMSI